MGQTGRELASKLTRWEFNDLCCGGRVEILVAERVRMLRQHYLQQLDHESATIRGKLQVLNPLHLSTGVSNVELSPKVDFRTRTSIKQDREPCRLPE
jgi:hypothetical protein